MFIRFVTDNNHLKQQQKREPSFSPNLYSIPSVRLCSIAIIFQATFGFLPYFRVFFPFFKDCFFVNLKKHFHCSGPICILYFINEWQTFPPNWVWRKPVIKNIKKKLVVNTCVRLAVCTMEILANISFFLCVISPWCRDTIFNDVTRLRKKITNFGIELCNDVNFVKREWRKIQFKLNVVFIKLSNCDWPNYAPTKFMVI